MTRPTPKRILVVDDDPGVVDYLVEMLTLQGYVSSGVGSAAAALQRLEEQRFDLLISDIEMPQMRGLDLLAAVHAVRPAQLVMLITAFGTVDPVSSATCPMIEEVT